MDKITKKLEEAKQQVNTRDMKSLVKLKGILTQLLTEQEVQVKQ